MKRRDFLVGIPATASVLAVGTAAVAQGAANPATLRVALLPDENASTIIQNAQPLKKHLEAALKFYQPAGYRTETSNALILLGRVYRDKGEYAVAMKAFSEQLEFTDSQRHKPLSQLELRHAGGAFRVD